LTSCCLHSLLTTGHSLVQLGFITCAYMRTYMPIHLSAECKVCSIQSCNSKFEIQRGAHLAPWSCENACSASASSGNRRWNMSPVPAIAWSSDNAIPEYALLTPFDLSHPCVREQEQTARCPCCYN
jgi:hypothetical protein